MEIIQFFIDLLQDPRSFIVDWIANLGPIGAYVPIFLIIFVETGVVIMPFLPGDSLLFAAGLFAADGGGLNLFVLLPVVWVAAIVGDQCNYWIGREFGRRIIDSGRVKSMTPERIAETEALLDKYGPVAIFLGRFFPFIRTFVPFFAGLGHMHYKRFFAFNVLGGIVWSTVFVLLGYFFGGIPVVQEHFEFVIFGIIGISLIPAVVGVFKAKFGKKKTENAMGSVSDASASEGSAPVEPSSDDAASNGPLSAGKCPSSGITDATKPESDAGIDTTGVR